MLTPGTAALEAAAANRCAVPGFVAYNLETAQGIVRAAENTGKFVLLQAGASAFRYAGFQLARLAVDIADSCGAAVGVHLDHSRSLDEIRQCIDAGYTSVMIDGSHLPFEENVALTAEAAELAHDGGVWIEAELGVVSGDEDVSTGSAAAAMTDPGQAADFVGRTNVDLLAVAVGNVHGWTSSPPVIDVERLRELRRSAGVPLVLHGASGLSDNVLISCIDAGAVKFNINTELRRAFLAAIADALPTALARDDIVSPLDAGRAAVTSTATRLINALSPGY